MNDTKLKIGLIAGILLVLLLGYGIFTLSSRAGKIAVNVTLYPSDIHATLDDKELRTGTMYLESGTYTLKGSKPGFEDLTKPVTINETQKTIVVAPTAVSPEAKERSTRHRRLSLSPRRPYLQKRKNGRKRTIIKSKGFRRLAPPK
jgi:hypothetical protein